MDKVYGLSVFAGPILVTESKQHVFSKQTSHPSKHTKTTGSCYDTYTQGAFTALKCSIFLLKESYGHQVTKFFMTSWFELVLFGMNDLCKCKLLFLCRQTSEHITTRWSANAGTTLRTASTVYGILCLHYKERR